MIVHSNSGLVKIHMKGKQKTFHYYLWLVCYYLDAVYHL